MVSTLGDSMSEFRKFAQDVDTEMGRAISRLANSMSIIEENADSIAQFAEALRSHDGRIEAAE